MQTEQIGIILLIGLLSITLITTSVPYTTSQFITQSTELNETNYFDGNYDQQILYIDKNKISTINEIGYTGTCPTGTDLNITKGIIISCD